MMIKDVIIYRLINYQLYLMDKNFQNCLTLLPVGVNVFIGGLSKKSRILILTIIVGI